MRQCFQAEVCCDAATEMIASRKTTLYETLSTASRAEPISPKIDRDENPAAMMQIDGTSSNASSRIRSP